MSLLKYRDRLWVWAMRSHDPGMIMTFWQRRLFEVLHPKLAFIYWVWKSSPYDIVQDIWTIHGVRYHGSLFRLLSVANGELIKIKRTGDQVTFEIRKSQSIDKLK